MGKIHLLGVNRSYDKDIQTVKENQITVFERYSGDRYVVFRVTCDNWGIKYHLINTRTFEFHQSNLIRPLSEKFGIGIYYDSENPTFVDPIETAELLTKATEKKRTNKSVNALSKLVGNVFKPFPPRMQKPLS